MTWLEYHELTKHSPINPSVYPPWRTTSGTRELLSTRTTPGYPVCVRTIQ
jgi:hypothetical protein